MNSTHPDGLFVKHLLVVLHNPEGRNILFGSHLKIVTRDRTEQRLIKPEERESVLRDIFLLHTKT
jgi:N-hydroxyarylamine O-acetyltransferase